MILLDPTKCKMNNIDMEDIFQNKIMKYANSRWKQTIFQGNFGRV